MPLIQENPMQSRTHAPQARLAGQAGPALCSSRARRDRQRGFTLLEVLVALVVLSIGLLGIGKLVMISSRGNDSAYMRSQATAFAYSILDDMRANRAEAISGTYNVATGAYAGGANCVTGTCNPNQLVQSDISNWKTTLAQQLPSGDGSITTVGVVGLDGQTRMTATITVQWNDWVARQSFSGAAAANSTASITLETIL
jgi:type IV pilus assembly protein PilV